MREFSVLMSLYRKETAEYFDQCMKSMLWQTVRPDEIVIVLDGAISDQVALVLQTYQSRYPDWIRTVPLVNNRGLGLALREGVTHCKYDLIARMDTDDIAKRDRFEKQLSEFEKDPELDICGGHIVEFEGNIENRLSVRKVPLTHSEIARYQKQRSAFNHVTVMFKKEAVLRAGNYEGCPFMEDDMLWIRMLIAGAKCSNIDESLVYVRTGYAMIERRGGWEYFWKYTNGRKRILDTGYISLWDYWKTICAQFAVSFLPKKLRFLVFTKLLREEA